MIYLIVAINLSITLLNIYIAIRIWQLGLLVARISTIISNYESYFNLVLESAPTVIYQGQKNIHQARQRYQLLQLQAIKLRQLIWLIDWSYRVWSNSKLI
jgi:hypothetical protein